MCASHIYPSLTHTFSHTDLLLIPENAFHSFTPEVTHTHTQSHSHTHTHTPVSYLLKLKVMRRVRGDHRKFCKRRLVKSRFQRLVNFSLPIDFIRERTSPGIGEKLT